MQNLCVKLLKGGIFDEIKITSDKSLAESFNSWLKTVNKTEMKRASSMGLDIAVPTEGGGTIPLGMNFTDDSWGKFANARDQGMITTISQSEVLTFFRKTPSNHLVTAYVKCVGDMLKAKGMTKSEAERIDNGQLMTCTVRWVPIAGGKKAVLKDAALSNAEWWTAKPDSFEVNEEVTLGFKIPNPAAAACIVLDTDEGDVLIETDGYVSTPPDIGPAEDEIHITLVSAKIVGYETALHRVYMWVNGESATNQQLNFTSEGALGATTVKIKLTQKTPKILNVAMQIAGGLSWTKADVAMTQVLRIDTRTFVNDQTTQDFEVPYRFTGEHAGKSGTITIQVDKL